MPKSIQFARWVKNQTILLVRKLKEVGRPKVMEAGQISKVLLIFIAQNLTTKGVPIILRIAQSSEGSVYTLLREKRREL